MKLTGTLALAAVMLTGWTGGPARAQPASPGGDAASNDLVEQAAQAYDQNQLDEALRLLSRAYQLSPRPSILYNQAQVLRAKDDCAAALEAYRRFIAAAAPDDANRERAERRRDEMQACVARQSPPAAAPARLNLQETARPDPPAGVAVTAPVPTPEEQHPRRPRRALRVGGWSLLGASVVAAGAAAVLAWEAHDIQNEVNADLQRARTVWSGDLAARAGEGQNDATRAWWCAGVAALAGAGSGALFLLSRPPAAAGDSPVTASARTPGALVGWSGSF